MKNIVLIISLMIGASSTVHAQKWEQLSGEQRMMKAIEYKDENHKYLKEILCLTDEQTADVEDINLCFLSTLDRIDRYGKTDYDKQKYAKGLAQSRTAQLDAIMGVGKRTEYIAFIKKKLKIQD